MRAVTKTSRQLRLHSQIQESKRLNGRSDVDELQFPQDIRNEIVWSEINDKTDGRQSISQHMDPQI
jgi:hypothetical protein